MNLDLKNVLLAKTGLRDKVISVDGLIKTSTDEAYNLLVKSGYTSKIVFFQKSVKIFKNLLKQFNTNEIYKFYRPHGKYRRHSKILKKETINLVLSSKYSKIKKQIEEKMHENTYT